MEISESPLDVLSRAATMVKDGLPVSNNADDALNNKHYTSKQVSPTTKWKRERRSRLPEYTRKSDPKLPENLPPELLIDHLDESNNSNNSSTSSSLSLSPKALTPTEPTSVVDTPLDMSIRQRGLPPTYSQAISNPTYRISSFRPSVITQAQTTPPVHHQDNGKYISSPKIQNHTTESKSISMCDPIIDEHFRRSLGKDYAILFSNNNVVPTTPSPPPATTLTTTQLSNRTAPVVVEPHNNIKKITLTPSSSSKKQHLTKTTNTTEQENGIIASFKEMMDTDSASLSVDDHFAKALGDTWFKLNQKENELNQKKNLKSEKNDNSIRVVTI